MPSVHEAIKLVSDIDRAILTGHGDTRSNAIVCKLLSIARLWIAEHIASDAALLDSVPTPNQTHRQGVATRPRERITASSAITARTKPNGKDRIMARLP